MRQITNVKREKNVYNIGLKELQNGKWIQLLKDKSDMVELSYKNSYLTISDCNIKKLSEKETRGVKNE